jgi:hypothetical protein
VFAHQTNESPEKGRRPVANDPFQAIAPVIAGLTYSQRHSLKSQRLYDFEQEVRDERQV